MDFDQGNLTRRNKNKNKSVMGFNKYKISCLHREMRSRIACRSNILIEPVHAAR